MLLQRRSRRSGRAFVWLVLGLVLGGAAGAGAMFLFKHDKPGFPGGPRLGSADELALVPRDAVGFIHVRARDVWKSEGLKELRKIVDQAGPENLALLDDNFVPKPSTLDRVTIVFVSPAKPGEKPEMMPPAKKGPPGKAPPAPAPGPDRPLLSLPEKVEPVGILTFTAPYDSGQIRGSLLPDGTAHRAGGKEYWSDAKLAAYFHSDTVMVLGTPEGLELFLGAFVGDAARPDGPLAGALEWAGTGGQHYVAAINVQKLHINFNHINDIIPSEHLTTKDQADLMRDATDLLRGDAFAIGGTAATEDAKVDIRAYFKDDADAVKGEEAVRKLAEFARTKLVKPREQLEAMLKPKPGEKSPRPIKDLPEAIVGLFGVGAINHLDGYLANPPLKRDGKELVASIELPSVGEIYAGTIAVATGYLFSSAPTKMPMAAATAVSSNNLKQISLAMLNYESAYGTLPAPGPSANKTPPSPGPPMLLSWRVQLLPFLDQAPLYSEFKLDEPWDSPANKKLIGRIPKVYECPKAVAPTGQTYYQVFTGGGAVFTLGKRTRITEITDGTSNTILAVEGGEPVIWTKPEDIPFDPKKPLPNLRLNGNPRINVVMVDGEVKVINLDTVSEKTLKAAITMAGDDVLGPDWPR